MTGCASQRNSKRGANQEFVINRHPALSNKNLGALQAIQEWPSLDRYAIEHSTHHNLYMMYSWKLTPTYGDTKSPTHITKCYDTLSWTAWSSLTTQSAVPSKPLYERWHCYQRNMHFRVLRFAWILSTQTALIEIFISEQTWRIPKLADYYYILYILPGQSESVTTNARGKSVLRDHILSKSAYF